MCLFTENRSVCHLLLFGFPTHTHTHTHTHTDALALNEELEFAAIQWIHGQLDDNADGTVDFQESEEVGVCVCVCVCICLRTHVLHVCVRLCVHVFVGCCLATKSLNLSNTK